MTLLADELEDVSLTTREQAVRLKPMLAEDHVRQDGDPASPLLPDDKSLAISDAAIYNGVAWVYYWPRGWLKPAG